MPIILYKQTKQLKKKRCVMLRLLLRRQPPDVITQHPPMDKTHTANKATKTPYITYAYGNRRIMK